MKNTNFLGIHDLSEKKKNVVSIDFQVFFFLR